MAYAPLYITICVLNLTCNPPADVKAHIAVLAAPSDGVDKHADILSAHTQVSSLSLLL